MNPILKFIVRLVAVIILALLVIKPYNLYCDVSGKCSNFNIAKYLPSSQGYGKIKVKFVNINPQPYIDFQAIPHELVTSTGQKNIVKYNLTNVTKNRYNPIKFDIKYSVEPERFERYIKRYQCLCGKSYKLKPNQSRQEEFIFKIDNDFAEMLDENNSEEIEIRYEINYKNI